MADFVEKTIFDIVKTETIVFSNEDIETLISINDKGFSWWFKGDSGNFILTDTLEHHNDLKRLDIVFARKTAEDWFNWELGNFASAGGTENAGARKKEVSRPTIIHPTFIDANKKDAHTEHCCLEHKFCLYKNKKCSVLSQQKKQSYFCRCQTG